MILVDTGPLVAVANKGEKNHEQCKQFLESAAGPLLVPTTVIAETCYMLDRASVGYQLEMEFLRLFGEGVLHLAELELPDLDRMAELVEQYADWPLGGTDASIVAIAERLNITDVVTLDRKHFVPLRPRHVKAFNIYPSDISG